MRGCRCSAISSPTTGHNNEVTRLCVAAGAQPIAHPQQVTTMRSNCCAWLQVLSHKLTTRRGNGAAEHFEAEHKVDMSVEDM